MSVSGAGRVVAAADALPLEERNRLRAAAAARVGPGAASSVAARWLKGLPKQRRRGDLKQRRDAFHARE